ncbi:MAG: hypothetical protein VR64_22425 [Desulfatitalea sp. BRH_c12]|nr:MAG: hypothetical protein VR64_22425 [Desulfatitalea sp. BRH_c12]
MMPLHQEREKMPERMTVPMLLPIGRDAELVSKMLEKESVDVLICESMHVLLEQICRGCGPFIVGDETFSDNSLGRMTEALDNQPDWSDLPGIILIGRPDNIRFLDKFATRNQIIVIQRPVKQSVFTSIIHSALEARRRQYEVRDLLEDLVRTNEELRSRTKLLQKIALELTRAENNERKRIAQILHDDLQQMIASARLQTEILLGDLNNEMAQKAAQPIFDILSQAMNASRNLSHELNPAFVIGGNLKDALHNKAAGLGAQYGFEIHTAIDIGSDPIDEDIITFVYRSVQEMLFNCAKHARAKHVSLELTRSGKLLTIMVADDGVGFDPVRLKIFGGIDGGLGLFSMQERAIALGGSFTVDSVPDEGSRFSLIIPLILEEVVSNGLPNRTEYIENEDNGETDAISVVIADDHAVMRQGLATLLRNQSDIKVVAEASDGEQAVAFALQLRPDVVLMDYSMPLLNGAEATCMIKNEAPEIAVIALSMYGGEDKQRSMHNAGAQAYLKKDVQAAELIAAIKQHARHMKGNARQNAVVSCHGPACDVSKGDMSV